jgi:hypothetical protein
LESFSIVAGGLGLGIGVWGYSHIFIFRALIKALICFYFAGASIHKYSLVPFLILVALTDVCAGNEYLRRRRAKPPNHDKILFYFPLLHFVFFHSPTPNLQFLFSTSILQPPFHSFALSVPCRRLVVGNWRLVKSSFIFFSLKH